jgi:cell division protein ZapB
LLSDDGCENLKKISKVSAYRLTKQEIYDYSGLMDSSLFELEEKINQLVTVVSQLRSENQLLRQQLAGKTDENKRLTEKIEAAMVRLDALLKQIPGDEEA